MKVVHSWLAELAPIGDDVDAVAAHLSALGMAVEEVQRVGTAVDGVVVARVLSLRKHPKADRIQLVDVDPGDGTPLQICCGAFNMREGDLVPLATLGTTMPNGMEIARRQMRGEWSNGMLCSARELEMGDDHGGIWILPDDLVPGTPLFDALRIRADVVYELDLTRNRPDAYCHLGVAIDLAARLGLPVTAPGGVAVPEVSAGPGATTVDLVDPRGCGRFTSTVITGVEVKPSPRWMADRLTLAGMRPINNVVDVSNYVMLELGQPNHAYDLATLGGGGFRVRRAHDGEVLVTLDGVARVFGPDDLLICDAADRPIGLAGIMGGENTEISDATSAVALEMAWFDPAGIAATVQRRGLRSEASTRFERGVDPWGIDRAIGRFVELLRETCPAASIAPGRVDARGVVPPATTPVRVRTARVNAVLGTALDGAGVAATIAPIGFASSPAGEGVLVVEVPSRRPDCTTEIDVVEEVARHVGYDALGKIVPSSPHPGRLTGHQLDRRLVREVMVGAGCTEAMPNAFLAPGDLARAGLADDGLTIANPLVAEESVLRTSLLPGLLRAVAYNASHRRTGVALFELGHVYRRPAHGQRLPDEREHLSAVLAACDAAAAVGLWHELAGALAVRDVTLEAAELPGLHPTRTARLRAGDGSEVGAVGEVDPDVAAAHGISERVAWLEVDLGALLGRPHGNVQVSPVSRQPSSDTDLAFVLDDAVPAARLTETLRAAGGPLVVELVLFDVYRGVGVPAGARSLAYRLRLQALDRTLTDADLVGVREACVAAAGTLGARLRA
jgi:phenylalanyl-tRNA synthetase beta chain